MPLLGRSLTASSHHTVGLPKPSSSLPGDQSLRELRCENGDTVGNIADQPGILEWGSGLSCEELTTDICSLDIHIAALLQTWKSRHRRSYGARVGTETRQPVPACAVGPCSDARLSTAQGLASILGSRVQGGDPKAEFYIDMEIRLSCVPGEIKGDFPSGPGTTVCLA